MNINNHNGRGQEQVVTLESLSAYCEWLNSTYGESFLKCTSGTSGVTTMLTFTSTLGGIDSSGNPYSVSGDEIGVGKITFNRTIESSTTTTSKNGDGTISIRGASTGNPKPFPRGTFQLTYSGRTFTMLDNTNTTSITGYDRINVTPRGVSLNKCLTYADITGSTYARYFNEQTMVDGLIVNDYSVSGNGQSAYENNQLVVEKDVNYGKLNYKLEVESITVEIDSMTDLLEYQKGIIPTNSSQEIQFATVYDKNDLNNVTINTVPFNTYVISGLTDNTDVSGKTYKNVSIMKGGCKAKAPLINGSYTLDVYKYADSGYTIEKRTITIPSTGGSVVIPVSNHTFTGSSSGNQSTYSGAVVTIASDGEVTFDIKQRKEIYGYFPVDVYREGSVSYGVNDIGNIDMSAITEFKYAVTGSSTNGSGTNGSKTVYSAVSGYSNGWLDNAGDNFGSDAMSLKSKTRLSNTDDSVYTDYPIDLGEQCGQDVYNSNNQVYDRGVMVGNDYHSTYHMAYANDAYSGLTGGLDKTLHLFCNGGTMIPEDPSKSCEEGGYFPYTYDEFFSEYEYKMQYQRTYYKDCHAYGLTSLIRRFRKINGEYVDSALSNYSTVSGSASPVAGVVVNGSSFPKHISGKTITAEITYDWYDVDDIQAGDNYVSGWTTVFESGVTNSDTSASWTTYTCSSTTRNATTNRVSSSKCVVYCQANEDEDTDYVYIAPKFYMVDAEKCDGICSGYTFTVPKIILDETNTRYGADSITRNYMLEYDGYWQNYGNVQKKRGSMITYLNVYDAQFIPSIVSTRYGLNGLNVESSCCPSAPVQDVHWVDTYAPYNNYSVFLNDTYAVPSANTSTNDYRFIDTTTSGSVGVGDSTIIIPATNNWSSFNNSIKLSDVNNFTESKYEYYNFAGQVLYSGSTNNSSHSLKESISAFSSTNYYDESSFPANCGYDVYDTYSGYENSGKLTMVSFDQWDAANSGGKYTGDTHMYFNTNGSTGQTRGGNGFKIIPLKRKNSDKPATRPCHGNVTIPYWVTDIYFSARYGTQTIPSSISQFGMQVFVDGYQLTSSGAYHGNINYKLVTSESEAIRLTRLSDGGKIPGIYGMLSTVSSTTGDYGTDQIVKLTLLFVDTYKLFDVKVECTSMVANTNILEWKINGREDTSVDTTALRLLGYNNWGEYKNNMEGIPSHTGDYNFTCVGSSNSVYSITEGEPYAGYAFRDFTKTGKSVRSFEDTDNHSGQYW